MFNGVLAMDKEKKIKNNPIKLEPGVFSSPTTSGLKTIANKPIEAYSNNRPKTTEADKLRKQAKAEMGTSSFRAQPFISPISGRKETKNVGVMIAHGIYDRTTGKVLSKNDSVVITEESMAKATFTLTTDLKEIITTGINEDAGKIPLQGRLVFSTLEGEFEIDANLVRVKLEDSDVYAQYDRTLEDVLQEQFGKRGGPKPFTRIIPPIEIKNISGEIMPENLTTTLLQNNPVPEEGLAFENQEENLQQAEDHVAAQHDRVLTVPVDYEEKGIPRDFYYEIPTLDLLEEGILSGRDDEEWIYEKMNLLEQTFENFGVAVTVTGEYVQGASVTQFEVAPDAGTKVSRIKGLAEDLKLSLFVTDLRIEAIAGKNTVGIEIANDERRLVRLKEVLSSPTFILHESPLFIGLGEDITGESVYADILEMPHGLIAGQTGSGKSVCINTLLISILYKATPDTLRLMLIDPKRVEMAPYNGIPHLVTPVITDEKKAATALTWAVEEMERRYDLFAKNGVRDINSFNKKRRELATSYKKIPYIVIVIDELADLMMVAASEVEDAIIRLTQKARSAGIHLILATQRPTVNVITGMIKSNIPTRISFAVAQANDSRVIIDAGGAEDLLGRGDMLISESGSKIRRVQGAFISDEEVARVVAFVKSQAAPEYLIADDALEKRIVTTTNEDDPQEQDAMEIFIAEQKASVSLLQRKLHMGYNRAAKLVDQLEAKKYISAPLGATSKRDVLLTQEELMKIFDPTT